MSKNKLDRKAFHIYELIGLPFLFLVFWSILFYLKPTRQIGLSFRYDLTTISLLFLMCSFLIFNIKGYLSNILFSFFFIILSALPLSGLWASGQTEPYTLFGLFPFSDARDYYESAQRYLFGGILSGIASYRPITPAFIALLLRIARGNLQAAYAIQTFIVSVSIITTTIEVRHRWGNFSAAMFSLLIFLFWRPFIGTFLTENLGLAFGLSAFLLLIKWIERKKRSLLFGVGFLLTIALNIRAGAYFVLPAILITIFANRKGLPKHSVTMFFLSILLAFVINAIISLLYSNQIVGFSSNIMFNLYQLVTDSESWRQFREVNPYLNPGNNIGSIQLIFKTFLSEPEKLIKALNRSYSEYFSLGRLGMYGFIEGERVHTTRISVLIGSISLYFLSIIGIINIIQHLKTSRGILYRILLASSIGIIISAPILYSGNFSGMRFFAATMPLQLIIPSLGLKQIVSFTNKHTKINFPENDSINHRESEFLSVFLLLFVLIGLFLNTFIKYEIQKDIFPCSSNESLVQLYKSKGNYINIVNDDSNFQNYFPYIKESKARKSSHGLSTTFPSEFKNLNAPFTIMSGVDGISNVGVFLIPMESEIPEKDGWFSVCVRKGGFPRLDNNQFVFSSLAYDSVIK